MSDSPSRHASPSSPPYPSDGTQDVFQKLKSVCVPLLENSRLSSHSVSLVSSYLSKLIKILRELDAENVHIRPPLLSYVFFPLSSLLGRNLPQSIPDQALEKIFTALCLLFEHWWWDCDVAIWEQIFKLAGAIVGGNDGKGKERDRDDETKIAAGKLLLTLLRERTTDSGSKEHRQSSDEAAHARHAFFKAHTQTPVFTPVLGTTLTALLSTASSLHVQLQLLSLQLINIIVGTYFTDSIIPSILPGVVSSMINVILGRSKASDKGLAKGAVVASALSVLGTVIVRAIGDDVCEAEHLVKELNDLDELAELVSEPAARQTPSSDEPSQYTIRTPSWLRATSSQLLVALNALSPLVFHPTPSALMALSAFSLELLTHCRLSLPQVPPLLLSFLLSLSNSRFDSVTTKARQALNAVLTPSSNARHVALQTLLEMTAENLAALPRVIKSRADGRIEHLAGQIEAVCFLGVRASEGDMAMGSISAIRSGVGTLLGPTGNIEKWGWSLLNVLQFADLTVPVTQSSMAGFTLEGDFDPQEHIVFPIIGLCHISLHTQHRLEQMLRSLGQSGGDNCVYAVEWLISVAQTSEDTNATGALWCAAHILEGIAGLSPDEPETTMSVKTSSLRLEKFARSMSHNMADFWNREEDTGHGTEESSSTNHEDDTNLRIEFVTGLDPIETLFDISSKPIHKISTNLRVRHRSICLRLICISSAILRSRFIPLLLYTLYPVLHSLVSSDSHLSSTAMSSLRFITNCTAYATPANLLVSNFDYALDALSRRLTRRWLEVDATKVLIILVRLVGADIVQRAGDIVEECYDRLDDFHGYPAIVDGLVEALQEVVKVIAEREDKPVRDSNYASGNDQSSNIHDQRRLDGFLHWFEHRKDPQTKEDEEDFGPAPRRAWAEDEPKEPKSDDEEPVDHHAEDPLAEPPASPAQALTSLIVSRSLYFLTHGSPLIRARILSLLSQAVPVLPDSAILPSIHKSWPFILNRLSDQEWYVVSAAAGLVEALSAHNGAFMVTRVWDDVWPRFNAMIMKMNISDVSSSLTKTAVGAPEAASAYSHSHRIYRSMLRTMAASVKGVPLQETKFWEVTVALRRFLQKSTHPELQECARNVYVALTNDYEDAVWLVLMSTVPDVREQDMLSHLRESKWDISDNVNIILGNV